MSYTDAKTSFEDALSYLEELGEKGSEDPHVRALHSMAYGLKQLAEQLDGDLPNVRRKIDKLIEDVGTVRSRV